MRVTGVGSGEVELMRMTGKGLGVGFALAPTAAHDSTSSFSAAA